MVTIMILRPNPYNFFCIPLDSMMRNIAIKVRQIDSISLYWKSGASNQISCAIFEGCLTKE